MSPIGGASGRRRPGTAADHADRRDVLVSALPPRREPGAGWTPGRSGCDVGAGIPSGAVVQADRRLPCGDAETYGPRRRGGAVAGGTFSAGRRVRRPDRPCDVSPAQRGVG